MPEIQKVFISYVPELRVEAELLSAALQVRGLKTWVDFKSLRPGHTWFHELDAALDFCDATVVLTTPEPKASRALNTEWETIMRKTWMKDAGFLLPVVFGGDTPVVLAAWIPLRIIPGTVPEIWTELVYKALTRARLEFGEEPLDELYAEQSARALSLSEVVKRTLG